MEFTSDEIKEFERLCNMTSSSRQMDRISGRLEMANFVEQHGKDKCDAMYAFLKTKWEKEDGRKRR
jgi:hypothetical protein